MKTFKDKIVKYKNAKLFNKKTKELVMEVGVKQLKVSIEELKKEYIVELHDYQMLYTAKQQQEDYQLDYDIKHLSDDEFNEKYTNPTNEAESILDNIKLK